MHEVVQDLETDLNQMIKSESKQKASVKEILPDLEYDSSAQTAGKNNSQAEELLELYEGIADPFEKYE